MNSTSKQMVDIMNVLKLKVVDRLSIATEENLDIICSPNLSKSDPD